MRKVLFLVLVVLLLASCSPYAPEDDGYTILEEEDKVVCEVEGHSKDYHATKYDFTAGNPMSFDVVDGKVVEYKNPISCTSHSFEVWRCATCGSYFKVFVHSYGEDGACTICGRPYVEMPTL